MNDLTLEISLKPFYGLSPAQMRRTCEHALDQWRSLVQKARRVSVMFWSADGSEILEYQGDLAAEMEWARYIGNGNAHLHPEIPADPEGRSLHARSYLYREDATKITYRRFAEIASIWREAIAARGKSAEIGLTFDPGGEFAPSAFKYERHREICLANTMGKASFVCCYGILDGDAHRYAGFPDGIPDGTSLGTFLGRQFRHFAADLGFDFLWFSNGFGFGMETWKTAGPLFDGEHFNPQTAPEVRDRIVNFWEDFRRECPDLRLRTRGTNLGTGTDLASDATPLRELYDGGFNFAPPPNSPWAALNGDFGLEIAGFMSRIAELPAGEKITFRFYLHDPWWLNSPWLDRYERQPHDIYLPLAVSQVGADGQTAVPENLNLLTLDDSYGRMPDIVPTESSPHFLRAWDERPDSLGPLVWLYPFDELHDAMFLEPRQPERLFHNDWFVREALNDGLPVNTVLSTRGFLARGPHLTGALAGTTMISPAPFDRKTEKHLLQFAEEGGRLLIYGPLESAPELRLRLGLQSATPVSGPTTVTNDLPLLDDYGDGHRSGSLEHRSLLSGGPLTEAALPGTTLPAYTVQGRETRALFAEFHTSGGGHVCWLRAPLSLTLKKDDHLPLPDDPGSTFALGELNRQAFARFGWEIGFSRESRRQRPPILTIHRHQNGWFFSGCMPDTTVAFRLRSPWGAPLLLGMETWIRGGRSTYHQQRGWRNECRVFVEQPDGWLQHTEELPGQMGITRRMWVRGLQGATIRFFPPTNSGPVTFWINPEWPFISGQSARLVSRSTPEGQITENVEPVTGTILISW
jgi:hypothetical protein